MGPTDKQPEGPQAAATPTTGGLIAAVVGEDRPGTLGLWIVRTEHRL